MNTKKQISFEDKGKYTQEINEISMPWGIVKEYIFTRSENSGPISLQTVIRQWRSKENKYRTSKSYQILENGTVTNSIYAKVRYNSVKNEEYLENKQEISIFFDLFKTKKALQAITDRVIKLEDVVMSA